MTQPTIRVERYQWFDDEPITNTEGEDAYPGADGAVWYEVEWPSGNLSYTLQPFARGPSHKYDKSAPGGPVLLWGWDGNREAPTLTPSFLSNFPSSKNSEGARIHLFLRKGKIDLCGDSTVVLKE